MVVDHGGGFFEAHRWLEFELDGDNAPVGRIFTFHADNLGTKPGYGAAKTISKSIGSDDRLEGRRAVAVSPNELPLDQGLPALRGALAYLVFWLD